MPDSPVTPDYLASALAARLIHDVIGPAGGIVSAFDLVADPRLVEMREEALAMAASTARDLVNTMSLIRTIYAGGEAAMSSAALAVAARKVFATSRAELTPRIELAPTAASTRVFLGLAQIMAAAAASGGTVSGVHAAALEGVLITFEAISPRAGLSEEVHAGLAGRSPGSGKAYRWSAAYLIGAIVRSTGGDVEIQTVDGCVAVRAFIRADTAFGPALGR